MNDKQLISFIEARAKKHAQANGYSNCTAVHLGLTKIYSNLYLCINYYTNSNIFASASNILRFKQHGQYGMFKLTSDSTDFLLWKKHLLPKMTNAIDYEKANVPKSIKHLVASTIIKALNTPGMALYVTNAYSSEPLINENENYASICIDYDLNFDEFIDI